MRILGTGNVGIGTTSPTAYLNIKAGTATASTAPLKFTLGVNLTTPEAGAIEYDGTNFYATPSSAVRNQIAIVNPTQTTLTPSGGAGAGTAICSQPFAGSSYKKVIVYFSGYTYGSNAQAYTYPVAFTNTPIVSASNVTVTATATTSTYTITAAVAQTGWVELEGF